MSSYYSDEEELDIRIHHGYGRSSPQPAVVYPEHRYRAPAPTRPAYYQHGSSYLEPQYGPVAIHRSRSTGHRPSVTLPTPPPPPPQPVIINNKIYNEERYDEEEDRREYQQLAHRHRGHSHSRSHSRAPSYSPSRGDSRHSRHSSRDEYELEATRRELERIRVTAEREEATKLLKKDIELKTLIKEREEEEERRRSKKEVELKTLIKEREEEEERRRSKKAEEEAVEKWKKQDAEKKKKAKEEEEAAIERWRVQDAEKKEKAKKEEEAAVARWKAKQEKEKKEKEEKEKEYQHRLEDDLRKAGYDERAISVVTKKEKAIDPNRPTFTRMSRRHLSIETLNVYKIDYEFDPDPNYVLIRRWVPEYEQDFLWNHTLKIREERRPVLVALEGKKKHGDVKFEWVKEKEHHHHRKPSPNPVLKAFLTGKR